MLREESAKLYNVGIVGSGRIARRFIPEADVVGGIKINAVFNPNKESAQAFAEQFGLEYFYESYEEFLSVLDAVYIASPHNTHYHYIKEALLRNKHVLCEIPMVLSADQASELYQYAEANNLVLLEASKTAFCPSFNHVITLVKSGVIGEIVDVKSSLSKVVGFPSRELDLEQAGGAINEHASLTLLPIIKLLGMDYSDIDFRSKVVDGVDIYTKVVINYPNATSSATVGIGVKTEGNLVISGTKGYIYVPAPWWLTSYFEVRYEDQTKNKKFFYSYDGDGLRYEIQEFISMIVNKRLSSYKFRRRESLSIIRIIEMFNNKESYKEI